jgi:caffeoyl-CoA O-methyltransferase
MFEFSMFDKKLDNYLNEMLPPRPSVVAEMETRARRSGFPIIGPHVGRLLSILARISGARRIFEMGSGFGYSAFWFAEGMRGEGRIIMTDGSTENRDAALDYMKRLGLDRCVSYKVGNALDILSGENEPFDIIYNDIDKEQYPQAYQVAIDKLRPGGMFISDNVLWEGAVAVPDPDQTTKAIIEFNNLLRKDARLYSAILPLRDGLTVAVRR